MYVSEVRTLCDSTVFRDLTDSLTVTDLRCTYFLWPPSNFDT